MTACKHLLKYRTIIDNKLGPVEEEIFDDLDTARRVRRINKLRYTVLWSYIVKVPEPKQ